MSLQPVESVEKMQAVILEWYSKVISPSFVCSRNAYPICLGQKLSVWQN